MQHYLISVCRNSQALSRLHSKRAVHDRALSTDRDPRARSGARTSARTGEGAGLRGGPTATAKSRSPVCGAEEPDRTSAAALAQTEIRARAILTRGHGPEPETAGAVPENQITPTGSSCDLRDRKKKRESESQKPACSKSLQGRSHIKTEFFNSHRRYHQLIV
jgi:hypothetical protein